MENFRELIHLATLSPDVDALTKAHGLGLELDEFCTAVNMDRDFDRWDALVRAHLDHGRRFVLHAPFAELSPCAVDPLVREVALHRFKQAAALCTRYGVSRMVVHSGYIPRVYFPVWFVEQASAFFRELLSTLPDSLELLIENVLESDPQMLMDMVGAIGDPRAKICLDVGHAHVQSRLSPSRWLEILTPKLAHLHLHDNDGSFDAHLPPGQGTVGFPDVLREIHSTAPRATLTFECPDAAGCIDALKKYGIL